MMEFSSGDGKKFISQSHYKNHHYVSNPSSSIDNILTFNKMNTNYNSEESPSSGPKNWLAQAHRLAVDAAQQREVERGEEMTVNLSERVKSEQQRHYANNRRLINIDTQARPTIERKMKNAQIIMKFRHNSFTKSRLKASNDNYHMQPLKALIGYAFVVLIAVSFTPLSPSQHFIINSVESFRTDHHIAQSINVRSGAGHLTAASAVDPNNLDLKQQMELIRGASSVELGRSGIANNNNLRIPSTANVLSPSGGRSQRSEPGAPNCGYPGSPAHASVTFNTSSVVAGTAASYTCDNGYELLGPPRRVCQANGTWSPAGIPFCVLNVGLGKAAMQSSTAGQGSAQRAVDGSTSPYFQASTCTMTDVEANPWWYVNLLEPYLVQIVRIDFGMACCGNRQKATIAVRVGNNRPDSGNNPLCNRYHGFIEEGKPLFLPCTRPAPGAFVSIHLESPSGSSLSICETFIYTDHALSIEQCPSFRDQPLGSTATYNGKCYLFHNNQALPFEAARKYCEQRGGSLVDETSPALQGFLSWELYRRHRNDQLQGQYWLGAVRDTRQINTALVPANSNSPNSNWKWINGKDVKITFWNSVSNQGNCSRFDGSKGWLWTDVDCDENLNFICQYRPLSCGKPEKPTNSSLITKNIDNGTIIEYQCAPGNLLMGPKSRTCLPTGFFSEFAPKCKYLDCQFPAQIPNGDYRLHNSTTSYQSVVTYFCQPGFQLLGRATLTCDVDERWNGPPPRCEPMLCSAPVPPTNGYVTVTSNVTIPGTQATYDCRSGYELVGEQKLICSQTGNWDHSFPYCRVNKRSSVFLNGIGQQQAQQVPPSTPAPKVHFPQSSIGTNRNPLLSQGAVTQAPSSPGSSTTNASISSSSTMFDLHQAQFASSTPPSSQSSTTTHSPPPASLNGLPGHFIGAGQASSSATVEPPAQHPPSTSTTTSTEILKLAPGQTAMDQSSSSESPIQALGEMISSSTGNSRPTHLLNSKPAPPQEAATGHQSNLINGNNRQQATDNFKHPIHGGPLATTNTISVHQQPTVSSVLASSTIPSSTTTQSLPKLDTTSNSNQNNLHLLNNGPAVNTQAPISNQGATSFSVQSPVSSSSPIGATGSAKEQHPSINLVQPPLMTNGGRGSGGNVLASSAGYAPPARSLHHQNSLASTKYSLDGIIATAILGGFIFLGAIITIIVIILRSRRKSGHSPSIDAQTICTFDSNGGAENNGFYRNYQQAWENLRFATAPGVQPKSAGSHHPQLAAALHQQQQHHLLAANAPFKNLNDTMVQQAQLHHAHMVASGTSSQSSSLAGSGGAGNDPLLQQHQSAVSRQHQQAQRQAAHQLRAAQRRSLQLDSREHQLCSEEDDEQGVLSADESLAMHRRHYGLSASANAVDQQSSQYLHTNEGFRDSNELTVGPDTRSVNTSNHLISSRQPRLYSMAAAASATPLSTNRLSAGALSVNQSSGSAHHHHHHHHHHNRNHGSSQGSGSQHQRLVSSSTATTTSSPSTSTRSSRASPQHSDDVDLDRLAYGGNWRAGGNASEPRQQRGGQ